MARFIDQLNREVVLEKKPSRIVSLVPSQTELLHDLGLENEVVGITKFCIHPETWYRSKTRVGGTKKLDLEKIRALQPDLIIGNKEENEEGQVRALMQEYRVWMSDIRTLDEACGMIRSIGSITGREKEADRMVSSIRKGFSDLVPDTRKLRTAYLIWNDPIMVAAKGTFIDDLLSRCGLENVFSASRYPETSEEELKERAPELILLSSEPFPFKEKHVTRFAQLCPGSKVVLADGEMFSWYGSRLLQAPPYLGGLLTQL
ncbi:MAG: helical backbone metal receptor [Bacteroidota bacterium]